MVAGQPATTRLVRPTSRMATGSMVATSMRSWPVSRMDVAARCRPSPAPFPKTRLSSSRITSPSLSKRPHDALRAELGRALFSNGAPCHGADGKGSLRLGAPNLTDDTWLYGDRITDIAETIRHGRNGEMPAWRARPERQRTDRSSPPGSMRRSHPPPRDKSAMTRYRGAWFRQPVVWLGGLILVGRLVLASRPSCWRSVMATRRLQQAAAMCCECHSATLSHRHQWPEPR